MYKRKSKLVSCLNCFRYSYSTYKTPTLNVGVNVGVSYVECGIVAYRLF